MPTADQSQPVTGQERILALDVLRGFAMVGVLIAYAMWSLGTAPDEQWSALDLKIGDLIGFWVDGKFYTILATLFGLGFSIQLGRAASDAAAVETYCRRLAILAGIGLLHALLLRNGDILLPYALTGFLLIPFRRMSDRGLLISALLILLGEAAIRGLWLVLGLPEYERPHLEHASYLQENVAWVRYWYQTAIFNWPTNLTMFLLGLLAGRRKLIAPLCGRPAILAAIVAGGLTVGTLLYFADRWFIEHFGEGPLVAASGPFLFTLHCWGISSAYAASLLLALGTRVGTVILTPLAAIGKLALTNYLLQAAIAVPICLAFGLFDTFTPTKSLLFAAAILAFELPFSIWWAKHYQFGPAEWFWRLLTYQRAPSMRRQAAASAASLT